MSHQQRTIYTSGKKHLLDHFINKLHENIIKKTLQNNEHVIMYL